MNKKNVRLLILLVCDLLGLIYCSFSGSVSPLKVIEYKGVLELSEAMLCSKVSCTSYCLE